MSLPQCAHFRAAAIIPLLLALLAAGGLPVLSPVPAAGAAETSTRLKVGLRIVPRTDVARRRMPAPPLPRPRPSGLVRR